MIPSIRAICLGVVAWFFCAQTSHACTCAEYTGTFSEYSKGQIVVRGKVTSYGPKLDHDETLYATMRVSVLEILNGSYTHGVVQFRGDPGNLCLTYIDADRYSVGSEHLFVLFSNEKKQDLAGCGVVSVSIQDGKVHGTRYLDKKWTNFIVDYGEFVESIKD